MKYVCPVCGYNALETPPADYTICPCCGTEFGYDDLAPTHEELRNRWIFAGARWFSKHTPAPLNWNVSRQLENLYRWQARPIVETVIPAESRGAPGVEEAPDVGTTTVEIKITS